MKIDAHYYAVLAFSLACGFKKEHAWDIAYASQFVDDAKINHITPKETPKAEVLNYMKTIDSTPCFFDMATCHSYKKIETFNYSSMINNTVSFHFIPGCEGDNFVKQMRCKAKGNIIQALFNEVEERGNLIELGIALHVFADTYSHQGFSGLLSKVNDIKNLQIEDKSGRILDKIPRALGWAKKTIYTKLDKIIPAYGHGQAMSFPDRPYLAWSYYYASSDAFSFKVKSSGKIDNKKRFGAAFMEIKDILKRFAERHPEYMDESPPSVEYDILYDSLTIKTSDKGRVNNWKNTILELGLLNKNDTMLDYDEHKWLKDAFSNFNKRKFNKRAIEGAVLADKFHQSKWYEYYKAVHWYKESFFSCCENIGQLAIQR